MGDRALGVASSKADIDGGTINNAVIGGTTPVAGTFTTLTATAGALSGGTFQGAIGGTTPAAGAFTTLAASGNVTLGDTTADTIGLYGITPIAQRAGATQATSLVSVTSASFATAYAAALLEIMNTLTALGIWKGSA